MLWRKTVFSKLTYRGVFWPGFIEKFSNGTNMRVSIRYLNHDIPTPDKLSSADSLGLLFMSRACYNPTAAITYVERPMC